MEFGDARVGAEKEKYGILGKTVKIIKTPLARHNMGLGSEIWQDDEFSI